MFLLTNGSFLRPPDRNYMKLEIAVGMYEDYIFACRCKECFM